LLWWTAGSSSEEGNRGDRRDKIFEDDEDRHRFLKTLAQTCDKTDWQVHALFDVQFSPRRDPPKVQARRPIPSADDDDVEVDRAAALRGAHGRTSQPAGSNTVSEVKTVKVFGP